MHLVRDLLLSSEFVLMATPLHGSRMSDREKKKSEPGKAAEENESADHGDDVIRIEDLAPHMNVKGGRKILLGEIPTPPSNPRIPPGS